LSSRPKTGSIFANPDPDPELDLYLDAHKKCGSRSGLRAKKIQMQADPDSALQPWCWASLYSLVRN